MINWKVRIKNKTFWITAIPAAILLIEAVANLFGFNIDLSSVNDKLIDLVKALFTVLAVAGVTIDPTTQGIGDSDRALEYETPAK